MTLFCCYNNNTKVIIPGFDNPRSKFAFDKAIFDKHGIRGSLSIDNYVNDSYFIIQDQTEI